MSISYTAFWSCSPSASTFSTCNLFFPTHPTYILFSYFLLFIFVFVKSSLWCPYILWCMVFYWSVLDLPQVTILKKTNFSFVSNYQLPTAHRLVVDICFPILHVVIWSGLSLHRSCTSSHNHCEFICTAVLLYTEDNFLVVIHCHWLLYSFCPSPFQNIFWALGGSVFKQLLVSVLNCLL